MTRIDHWHLQWALLLCNFLSLLNGNRWNRNIDCQTSLWKSARAPPCDLAIGWKDRCCTLSETEEPTINEVTMAGQQAAVTVVLSGPVSERALVTVARELKNRLEGISEVLEVEIGGDREDIVEIVVDPLLMESYGLDQTDILNLLSRNNRLVPAGTMDNGKGSFAVKVPSVFESVKDVMEQPVKVQGDSVITFQDVAQVRRSYKDPTSFARLNGEPSVSLEVKKRPGENMLETVANVKTLVTASQQSTIWPASINVSYTGDQTIEVNMMLNDLQNNVSMKIDS